MSKTINTLLIVPMAIYKAYWLTVLWALSAVSYYGANEMSIGQGLTVTFLWLFFAYPIKPLDMPNGVKVSKETFRTIVGLVMPPIITGLFWLVSKFI